MTKYQRAEEACQEQQREIEAALASRKINKVRLGWCGESRWHSTSPMLVLAYNCASACCSWQVLQDGACSAVGPVGGCCKRFCHMQRKFEMILFTPIQEPVKQGCQQLSPQARC